MFHAIHRTVTRWLLQEPEFAFLWEPDTSGEVVSIDCETTGLNMDVDEIISICAIKIRGSRILTSERLELLVRPWVEIDRESIMVHRLRPIDVAEGLVAPDAVARFLRFVGSRPLVGYYIAFDVAMINKYMKIMMGTTLPNRQIEVSGLYYKWKYRGRSGRTIDLRFNTIMEELDLPVRDAHDAFNDALMTAMMYVKLQSLTGRLKRERLPIIRRRSRETPALQPDTTAPIGAFGAEANR